MKIHLQDWISLKLTVMDRANSICITAKILKAKLRWASHVLPQQMSYKQLKKFSCVKVFPKKVTRTSPRSTWGALNSIPVNSSLLWLLQMAPSVWHGSKQLSICLASQGKQQKRKESIRSSSKSKVFEKPYLHIEVQLQKSHVWPKMLTVHNQYSWWKREKKEHESNSVYCILLLIIWSLAYKLGNIWYQVT